MKPSVYIETTIPSYLVARPSRDIVLAGHQQVTNDWWQNSRPNHDLFISQYVITEVSRGEQSMAQKRLDVLQGIPLLPATTETEQLARELIRRLNLPEQAKTDAYHIAIAAVHGIDFLLTWNCTHINNMHMQRRIEIACQEAGYSASVIGTPEELI
ncbi:type II toxin-antitoxin system VapC family toxin [Prosthecobacter sp.]|uniref:type II toxin-antitoxin system VapC family toxin n=1 Tax=Prosthecobacter sp. TaxID=1965333 RepID=UPI002486D095|nr:type II toxin-antitoxin system VapC family toxin [Prosthecobacter sp.]MDI1310698.1 type II toxin-antitoxin system VapC family toxin [Prosthecobacter sp.]